MQMCGLVGEGSFMSLQGHVLAGELKHQENLNITLATVRGMSYGGAQILWSVLF